MPGWIIEGDALQQLIAIDSSLTTSLLDSPDTVVLAGDDSNPVPAGWSAARGRHYTAAGNCDQTTSACFSAKHDIGVSPPPAGTVAMCDLETWTRTPASEQAAPCPALASFAAEVPSACVSLAAPDQNLAAPGSPMSGAGYKGGESQNWQSYLRLGLGTCAASSGADRYHVMSQPFECTWGPNPQGNTEGSEQDFINFCVLAAAQARAVNPAIGLSYGLSTNTKYNPTASKLYRNWADLAAAVPDAACWLNVIGPGGPSMAVSFLRLVQQQAATAVRSCVFWPQADGSLAASVTAGATTARLDMSTAGAVTFTSGPILAGGTVIPAGCGELQFWTDGASSNLAHGNAEFGYRNAATGAKTRLALMSDIYFYGSQSGACRPAGAFTSPKVTLPAGSFQLYVTVTVTSPAPVGLLYGAASTPTALATPVLVP